MTPFDVDALRVMTASSSDMLIYSYKVVTSDRLYEDELSASNMDQAIAKIKQMYGRDDEIQFFYVEQTRNDWEM